MAKPRLHPRYETLSSFSDGDLPAPRHKRIAKHLERCDRCRREVGLLRDARRAINEVPVPSLPSDLFDRIVARREANIRTLLPEEPIVAGIGRPSVPAGLVTVGLVLLFAAGALLWADRAVGDFSAASFESLDDGAAVRMTYVPSSFFESESRVRARVEMWTSAEAPSRIVDRTLSKTRGGFAGDIIVPDDVVFARAAVESEDGSRWDSNGGRFWEVDRGRGVTTDVARIAAMTASLRYGSVEIEDVQSAAAALTDAYPNDVEAWATRAGPDLSISAPNRDRLLPLHEERLTRYSLAALDAAGVTPERLSMLAEYAATVRDAALESALIERLESIDPHHSEVIEHRQTQTFLKLREDPVALLEAFEREWLSSPSYFVASIAYVTASRLDDLEATGRWARRTYDSAAPEDRDPVGWDLVETHEGLERLAIPLIRERLAWWGDRTDHDRPLHMSTSAFEREIERTRARLQGALGLAQARTGETATARRFLTASLESSFRAETARHLLTLLQSEGNESDRALARSVYARLIVDPLSDETAAPDAWADWPGIPGALELSEARSTLKDHVRDRGRSGIFESGAAPTATTDSIVVMAVWRAVPTPDHPVVYEVEQAIEKLSDAGVRLVVAAPTRFEDRLRGVARQIGAEPLPTDGPIVQGLAGVYRLWDYVVARGRRFDLTADFQDAVRLALLEASPQTANESSELTG
ncbi:MAG: hypothetical protein MJB57_16235 [Gemmatimonadetes bacterium]|nr:hypothetical protein [Gemmatimonadota bacterium]